MDGDCLKLTAYFGERKRSGNRLIADALLELYGQRELASSILLRGVGGFGLRHHLRTDTTLSLSEDLPAVAIAVDTRTSIEAVLPVVTRICTSGLLTVERARLLTEPLLPLSLPEQLHEATKLTVYLGRQEQVGRAPAYLAVGDLLFRRGIAGASVLLGVDGTAHGERQRARFFSRNAEVPVMVIAVGAGQHIERVLPELGGLLRRPLVTLERVQVCKRDGELLQRPHPLPAVDEHGMQLRQKLMIYTSDAALHNRRPIHREVLRRLRGSGASGATTLRGIWGFHGDHVPHGDRVFQRGRHVPVVTVVIDSPDVVARSFSIIDELTSESGLVTAEMVPALRTSAGNERRGGLRLARHNF